MLGNYLIALKIDLTRRDVIVSTLPGGYYFCRILGSLFDRVCMMCV